MASAGKSIAAAAPPPDKLKKSSYGGDDEVSESSEEDEDKAAAAGIMEGFLSTLGLKGVDAEAACEALEEYLDARGYSRR